MSTGTRFFVILLVLAGGVVLTGCRGMVNNAVLNSSRSIK